MGMPTQAYAILRQRYMTGGEALINHWHDRIASKTAAGDSRKAVAAQPNGEDTKKRSMRNSESSKFWSALLELVDVNAQVPGSSVSRQHMHPHTGMGLQCAVFSIEVLEQHA